MLWGDSLIHGGQVGQALAAIRENECASVIAAAFRIVLGCGQVVYQKSKQHMLVAQTVFVHGQFSMLIGNV